MDSQEGSLSVNYVLHSSAFRLLTNYSVRNLIFDESARLRVPRSARQLKEAVKVRQLIFICYETWPPVTDLRCQYCLHVCKQKCGSQLFAAIIGTAGPLKGSGESPKVSLLLSFVPHSLAGLFSDKGPRGERRALGASQLGLVYFPLLSNKRHFLVLMAWKGSVIKIQTCGVTKREPEPCLLQRPFIIENGSQHNIVMGGYDNRNIYNTLLTSVCKYNSYHEDNTHRK